MRADDAGIKHFSQDIGGWEPGVYVINHNLDSSHVVANHGGPLNIEFRDENTLVLYLSSRPPIGMKIMVTGI